MCENDNCHRSPEAHVAIEKGFAIVEQLTSAAEKADTYKAIFALLLPKLRAAVAELTPLVAADDEMLAALRNVCRDVESLLAPSRVN